MTTARDDTSRDQVVHRGGAVRRQLGQLMRYGAVGILVTATDYSIYLLLVHLGFEPVVSNALSRIPATCVGALLHRMYTFAGPQQWSWLRQMVAYVTLSALNLVLSSALIFFLHDVMGMAPFFAKLATDVVVILVSWFVGRFVIFKPRLPEPGSAHEQP